MATGTITNRISDPSGTAVPNVTVNARLMPGMGFRTGTFYEVSQLETTTTDSNGDWSLTLEINTDITPGDSYYEIEEQIPLVSGAPAVWSVQVAAGTHTLYASLVSTPPSVSVPSYLTQSVADARYLSLNGNFLGGGITAVGTGTVTGTATVAARADHAHPLSPAVVGSGLTLTAGVLSASGGSATIGNDITLVGTNTVTGTATTAASSTHQHALSPTVVGWGLSLTAGVLSVNSNSMTTTVTIPTVGALPTAVGTNTVTGTSTQYAPANHGHQLSPAVVGSGLALSAGVLSVTTVVPVVGASPTAVGTNTVTGTATTFAPANHGHQLDPAVVGNDLALSAGVLSVSPRVPVVGGLVQPVGTATITGTATTYAASNHAHPLSPAVVGSGLTLTAGVLSASGGAVPVGGDEIRAVSTGTSTGTTTTFARTNHQHTLDPTVISTGLLLSAGVVTANIRALNYVTCTATTTQVYTVPTGVKALLVQVVGAGGGGGGTAGSATLSGAAAGGGSGSYGIIYITSTATAYSYNCGIKGPGGTAGQNDGTAGTSSVFGHGSPAVTAPGGAGGVGSGVGSVVSYAPGGAGGAVATNGTVNESGQSGQWGWTIGATQATGGPGAASVLGGGGSRTDGNVAGNDAPSHGAGGSGSSVRQVNTARAGGNGGNGLIIIQELYGS